jgi:hypothetical protein
VTLGGECFEVEIRSSKEYADRDGVLHKFHLTGMVSKRVNPFVSVLISG